MTGFNAWWDAQSHTAEAKAVAMAAWRASEHEQRLHLVAILQASPDQLRLMAGEMTPQELRTVRSILQGFIRQFDNRS